MTDVPKDAGSVLHQKLAELTVLTERLRVAYAEARHALTEMAEDRAFVVEAEVFRAHLVALDAHYEEQMAVAELRASQLRAEIARGSMQ